MIGVFFHPIRFWKAVQVARRHNKEVYRRGHMQWERWTFTGSKVSDRYILSGIQSGLY